jgi:hypothetical protein
MSEPPKGYRPTIPMTTKFNVAMRQDGRCPRCGNKLGEWKDVQFDHDPALQLRAWSEDLQDTLPAANDVEFIRALHKDCHAEKTTGRRGESKLSKRGGDISEVAKVRRITRKEEEFRKRLLTKGDAEPDSGEASSRWPRRKMQSRPFPKRKKGSKNERQDE